MNDYRFIHLLYVPTMACNLKCKYCYLEDNTKDINCDNDALDTLKFAVEKFRLSKVIPFNISLHGGEVTVLKKEVFYSLVEFIFNYYQQNKDLILSHGFKIGSPHIKTNLFSIKNHIEAIKKFNVSISGSLDLPLFLHDEYRITKSGQKTLETILENINLLKELPNHKKVSATIFKEHFNHIEKIISDIKYLEQNTCLDMNDFNFMIGFDYNSNGILHAISQDEQVEFFNRMHQEFDNTSLDTGVNGPWFNEFGPEYCTNCTNCGEKFFLLEKNGDIYSCVRGQKQKDFFYGNIFKNSVEEILQTAKNQILKAHQRVGINPICAKCEYLYLCKTGCPFVKNNYNQNISYTCKLQKELYKKRNYQIDKHNNYTLEYLKANHPKEIANLFQAKFGNTYIQDSLFDIIKQDKNLSGIYDKKAFKLKIDQNIFELESQILKTNKQIAYMHPKSKVIIYIREDVMDLLSDYPLNNSLYIQLLSGDTITYGDENRQKQKHIANLLVYKPVLMENTSDQEGYYMLDISKFLQEYGKYLSVENTNNIFFTTSALRDYHYSKQKNNAYYHIQAINLPFQNLDFYYIKEELL